jgi:hypothetical protein
MSDDVRGAASEDIPLCKVRARDGTGREIEILCNTTQAQEVSRDFRERGYRDVEIQGLLRQSRPQE